ncbi:hypothetical protein [Segetibacter aerophilus]|uniref:Uncharacterized protein n=1 Tax=Segetibacter aerophilus TaxID=670293 RepID=A0A512BBX1_9BACT|nr:hypothetical protein [Segetibacter aerophilus]GEO09450.1 hypothetical protein SAE01_19460 [Segetibacter aerophilus]
MRKIFHESVDKSQKAIDKLDKKDDHFFNATNDSEVNQQITYALYNKIDQLQDNIEADNSLDANQKVKFIRSLNEALALFESSYRNRELKGDQLPDLLNAYEEAMALEKKKQSIKPVLVDNEFEIGDILVKCIAFQKNVGITEGKEVLLLKNSQKHPDRIFQILKANPNALFADSLLKVAAHTHQEDVYTYAQSNTVIGKKIQNNSDPLIKTIAGLANLKEGRLYFPFLDNLYRGKVSIEEIDKNKNDEFKYYKLLVNTQIEYTERLRQRDTPMAMEALTEMLRRKAIESFINVINGLHDEPDNIRMKKVETLTPQELYYLCVMAETEIYTSSYLKVYERIFQRMKNPNSDSLLISVNFDHFKKFIKMAANYNTLDNFLKRMEKGNAEILMRSFAGGLEKTGSLEDAVDVADSYASISDPTLRKLILDEVQSNLNQQNRNENKRGLAIYDLLNNIFLSLDSTSKIDISQKFGIPPIYIVNNNSLKDSKGRIVIQQFFFGDKDGLYSYSQFKSLYNTPGWKIVNKTDWIEVSSTKGIPVIIYANKPLDEKEGLDDKAQENLGDYLSDNNLTPTVVIHRGHSYHVTSTIKQLVRTTKVVFLGSCGGYQNINRVLEISPYAHIIASKQTGTGAVNGPMIMSITETLRQGKDLNWPEMWKDLGKKLKDNNMFEDYVPPYKNLGALFIMAYNKVMLG